MRNGRNRAKSGSVIIIKNAATAQITQATFLVCANLFTTIGVNKFILHICNRLPGDKINYIFLDVRYRNTTIVK